MEPNRSVGGLSGSAFGHGHGRDLRVVFRVRLGLHVFRLSLFQGHHVLDGLYFRVFGGVLDLSGRERVALVEHHLDRRIGRPFIRLDHVVGPICGLVHVGLSFGLVVGLDRAVFGRSLGATRQSLDFSGHFAHLRIALGPVEFVLAEIHDNFRVGIIRRCHFGCHLGLLPGEFGDARVGLGQGSGSYLGPTLLVFLGHSVRLAIGSSFGHYNPKFSYWSWHVS